MIWWIWSVSLVSVLLNQRQTSTEPVLKHSKELICPRMSQGHSCNTRLILYTIGTNGNIHSCCPQHMADSMTLGGHERCLAKVNIVAQNYPKSGQSEVRSQQVELFEQNICTFNLDIMGTVSFHLPHSPPQWSGYMMLHDSLPHLGIPSTYDWPDTIRSHVCTLHIGVNRWPC